MSDWSSSEAIDDVVVMGQAVTVANASGDRLYVKVQSSVVFAEKTDLTVSDSTPTSAAGSATGKIDIEVSTFN